MNIDAHPSLSNFLASVLAVEMTTGGDIACLGGLVFRAEAGRREKTNERATQIDTSVTST